MLDLTSHVQNTLRLKGSKRFRLLSKLKKDMIPSKRPSPFTRAKSFQTNNARKSMDSKPGQDTSSPPFAKRTFTRTMSSPFQVVSPTMASTKNPFEKLSQSSVFASPSSRGSASLPKEYSGLNIKENDESEVEFDAFLEFALS